MNISKALKTKNRIARANKAQLEELLTNVKTTFKTEEEAIEHAKKEVEIYTALANEAGSSLQKISKLKTDIAIANSKAWSAIFMMGELKGMLQQLHRAILVAPSASITEQSSHNKETTTLYHTSRLCKPHLQGLSDSIQKQIDDLQDELDEHNAKTTI